MNHRSGINGAPLDRRHTNWAQCVRSAGYEPLLFGFTDTSADPRDYPAGHPLLRTYEGVLPGLTPKVLLTADVTPWAEWLAAQGVVLPERLSDLYYRKGAGSEWEAGGAVPLPLALDRTLHDTYFLTEQVIGHLTRATAPWTVHLSLLRPHPPWIAPAPYNSRYPPAELPNPVRAASWQDEARQHPWLAFQLGRRGYLADDDDRRRRLQASYFGLMSEVDDNLGRLVAHLKASGQYQQTLIVFTSDHGEQMGDHWLLGKCGYFEQSYHIPLLIRDPRSAADATRGRVVDAFTEHVDLMPTLLDWLDIDIPPACDGLSLLPFLRSADPVRWRDAAHWEFDFRDPADPAVEQRLGIPMHACSLSVLRGARYKYVHFAGLPPLLFDLDDDPTELHDLATQPAYLAIVSDCAQQLLSWRMRHAEQTLTHLALTPDGVVERRSPRW
jgi:arylsulfatase A-like enzyme